VIETFEMLDARPFFRTNNAILEPLMDYFLDTWIGGFNRIGRRKPPLFPIAIWNCYDSVIRELPKTNNFCEGFHNGFASLLRVLHPKIPQLVEGLLKDATKTAFRREIFNASRFDPPDPKSKRHAESLRTAILKYGTIPNLEYLRLVALKLKF